MKAEEILRFANLTTLLVIFFNTVMKDDGNFYVISSYREAKSKYAFKTNFASNSHDDTARRLSEKYRLKFKKINNTTIVAEIINSDRIELDDFLNYVYQAIISRLPKSRCNLDAEIAESLFELRGSADFTMGFYSVDLKNPTARFVDNMFKLLLSSDELLSRLNLNFRELQPQFVSGVAKRNTQIRVNLRWYFERVVSCGYCNSYKAELLKDNIRNLGENRKYGAFEERLILYREGILGRALSDIEINNIRDELEFSENEIRKTPDNIFVQRNQKIVTYARETFDDICVGCNSKYKIEDRSFIMPKSNRYYLEINHVIPYANDSNAVDVLDNLVKLCPTCHRALTPGRATMELQKEIIRNELNSRLEVKKFVVSMMPSEYSSPIDYVYSVLK